MNSSSKRLPSREADASLFDVFDDLVATRLHVREILIAATSALSEVRSGTWVASLMRKDPSKLLIVAADRSIPSLVNCAEQVADAIDLPGAAPTTSLSQQVIETGHRVYLPRVPYEEFVARLTPVERDLMRDKRLTGASVPLDILMVPMRSRGSTVGTLGLYVRDASTPLVAKYALRVQMWADRIAAAAENAQLYEDSIVRLARLSSMHSIGRAISANMDLAYTLRAILEHIVDQLKVDAADALLLEESDGMLVAAATTGFAVTVVPDFRLPVDEVLSDRARTRIHIEVVTAPSSFKQVRRRSLFAREGFKSYLAVPLVARGKLAGVLEVFCRSALNPDEEWLSFLDSMATLAAIALDVTTLSERMAEAGARSVQARGRVKTPQLSKTEWEMLKLLVEGQTNREISEQVHLSENTIKFHVRQMLQKTGTTNRTDLTRRAIREGWL